MKFQLLFFVELVSYGVIAQSLSDNTIKFLAMGDWGTQTSSGKRRLLVDEPLKDNNQRRKLQQNNNIGSKNIYNANTNNYNNNKNNGNYNNNNKNNGGEYWSVLVAKAMANYASKYPADFLIALGDNFYNSGVTSISDSLWTLFYNNVYNYDSLQIPWYAIFGNHDYGSNKVAGSIQAQIDYGTYKMDNRWHAGHCYLQSFTVPNTTTTLDIIFIDTNLIAPEETYMTSTTSGITEAQQSARRTAQLECMESYLAQSEASYLIVAGHYPIFSTGKNSPGDMTSMVEAVYPLLEKYNVDMYLCGHDHILEHLEYTTASGSKMDFIISGAGGKPEHQLTHGISSDANMMFAAATGGFAFFEITTNEMIVKLLDYTGSVIYQMTRPQSRVLIVDYEENENEDEDQYVEDEDIEESYNSNSSSNDDEVTETDDDTSLSYDNNQSNSQSSTLDEPSSEIFTNNQTLINETQILTNELLNQMSMRNSFIFGMNKLEMTEISILVVCLLALLILVFVVTSPRFTRPIGKKMKVFNPNDESINSNNSNIHKSKSTMKSTMNNDITKSKSSESKKNSNNITNVFDNKEDEEDGSSTSNNNTTLKNYTTASNGSAAGKPDNQLSNGITSDATSMFAAATGGFAFAEVSDTGISVNMVNSAGAVLYNMYRARQRVVFSSATELGSAEKSSSSNNNNNVKNEADQSSGNNKNQNANNNNNGQEQEQENSARTQYMNSYLTNAVMKELVEVGVLVSCIAAFIVIVGVLAAPRFNRTTAITKSVRKLTTPMDVDPATVDVESGWNKPRRGGGGGGGGVSKSSGQVKPAAVHMEESIRSAASTSATPAIVSSASLSPSSRVKLSTRRGKVMQTKFTNGATTTMNNLHESNELRRPTSEAIADAIAETAKRLEKLGAPVFPAQNQLPVIHLRSSQLSHLPTPTPLSLPKFSSSAEEISTVSSSSFSQSNVNTPAVKKNKDLTVLYSYELLNRAAYGSLDRLWYMNAECILLHKTGVTNRSVLTRLQYYLFCIAPLPHPTFPCLDGYSLFSKFRGDFLNVDLKISVSQPFTYFMGKFQNVHGSSFSKMQNGIQEIFVFEVAIPTAVIFF
eukprot:gene627-1214_t